MTDALAVARSNWRVRGRAWISLGLLAGLGAGAVMTAAIGARRTDSAYTRFNRAYKAAAFVPLGAATSDEGPEGNDSQPPSAAPTPMTLQIVGIEAAPGEFPPHLSVNNTDFVRVSPATVDAVRDKTRLLAETLVRLRNGQ